MVITAESLGSQELISLQTHEYCLTSALTLRLVKFLKGTLALALSYNS